MLRLKKIEFENFLSFYGHHEFEYASSGIHLIQGINKDDFIEGETSENTHSVGSGKSTFCNGPDFAFFGEVSKKINKDNMVNKKAKKNAMVALDFEVDGEDYRIERYRKHKKYRNDVLFFHKGKTGWENISRSDNRETQKDIQDLIVINEDIFLKSILLTRDDFQQFLAFGSPDRMRMFENIIQLNKFKEYFKVIDTQKKQEEELNGSLVVEILALQKEMATYQQHIKEDSEDLQVKEEKIKSQIRDLKEKMKNFSNKKSDVEKIIADISDCYSLLQSIKECNGIIDTIQTYITSEESILKQIEKRMDNFSTKLASKKKLYKELKPVTCHNCGATQNESEFKKKQKEHEKDISDWEEQIHKEVQSKNASTTKLKQYEKELNTEENKKQKYESEFEDIKIPKEFKLQIIKDVKNNKINRLTEELKDLDHQLKLKETELSSISWESIDKFKEKVKHGTSELKKLSKQREQSDKRMKMLDFLYRILDLKNENSIKQHILSQVLPVFNNIIQQNMNKIYNGNLTLMFDQFLNETIIYNDDVYQYSELSTGEQVKANLGVNLSIFDMAKINLHGSSVIFIDEIFSNVDPATIYYGLKWIEEKYAKDSAVYLISHHPLVHEYLGTNNCIKIIKENKESRIEVQ